MEEADGTALDARYALLEARVLDAALAMVTGGEAITERTLMALLGRAKGRAEAAVPAESDQALRDRLARRLAQIGGRLRAVGDDE
jgi:hypothetical protein